MDVLSAFRYLIEQRDRGAIGDHAAVEKDSDRLFILGHALRDNGYACDLRSQDFHVLTAKGPTFGGAMAALMLECGDGRVEYAGVDGTIGADALLDQRVERIKQTRDLRECMIDASPWAKSSLVNMDVFLMLKHAAGAEGAHCLRLIDIAASALRAHQLTQATAPATQAERPRRRM